MAGLMNRFWGIFGLDEPIEEEEELIPETTNDVIVQEQVSGGSKVVPLRGMGTAPQAPSGARVSSSAGEVSASAARGRSQVVVFMPQKMDELPELVRHLRDGHLVVTSFEGTPETEMRYWLSFIFGAACALDGTAQKISTYIYLVVPKNVDVTSNLKEILLARDSQERLRMDTSEDGNL